MYAVLYAATTVLSLALLAASSRRNIWTIVLLTSLLFGVVGFCIIPRDGVYIDMIRFFDTLDSARLLGGNGIVDRWQYLMANWNYDGVPVAGIILAFCSMLDNNGWINFLAGFVDVFAGLYLVAKASTRLDSKSALVFGAAFFLVVFNYMSAVSGVRTNMASSIACCLAYRHLVEGRRGAISYLAYIPLVLIHPFSAIVPAVDISALLSKRHRGMIVVAALLLLSWPVWQTYLFSVFEAFSFIPFFGSLAFKSSQYFGEGAYIGSPTVFSRWRSILLFIGLAAFVLYSLRRTDSLKSRYGTYTAFFLCLCLGCVQDEEMFSRCTSVMLFVSLPYMVRLWTVLAASDARGSVHVGQFMVGVGLAAFMYVNLVDNMRAGVAYVVVDFGFESLALLFACILVAVLADGTVGLRYARASRKGLEHARP